MNGCVVSSVVVCDDLVSWCVVSSVVVCGDLMSWCVVSSVMVCGDLVGYAAQCLRDLGTLPEDRTIMPKHVGATIHN
jgi:hypothetical protein